MNLVDLIVLVFVIVAVLWGLKKGFISQAISVISLFLASWIAYTFAKPIGASISHSASISAEAVNAIVFVVLFIAVVLVLQLIGKILEKTIRLVMLGWLNRLLGAGIALVIFGTLAGLILILFDSINSVTGFVSAEYLEQSFLYQPLQDFVGVVFPYLRGFLFHG